MHALESCFDPCCRERGLSMVDMGLVERKDVQEPNVSSDLVLTTGWYPFVARYFPGRSLAI